MIKIPLKVSILISIIFVSSLSVPGVIRDAYAKEYSLANIPHFSDFKVEEIYKGKAAKPNFQSWPGSRKFRTRLTEESAKGPNFAGHYTIATIGCGSECQTIWVLDAQNGKILGNFVTSYGADFQLDSRLLILNPLTPELIEEFRKNPESPLWVGTTGYIQIKDNKLKSLYKIDLLEFLEATSRGIDVFP